MSHFFDFPFYYGGFPMAGVPWTDISVYVGPAPNSYTLIIDGIEMPSEYALKFIYGSVTQADVDALLAIIEQHRTPPPGTQPRPFTYGNQYGNVKSQRARGELPSGEDKPVPTPEEAGLNIRHLEFVKWMMERGAYDEWIGQTPPDNADGRKPEAES